MEKNVISSSRTRSHHPSSVSTAGPCRKRFVHRIETDGARWCRAELVYGTLEADYKGCGADVSGVWAQVATDRPHEEVGFRHE